ncbi:MULTISPECIES: NAD-dependent epimerase/dehydratase family protein [unclassified Marinovum]
MSQRKTKVLVLGATGRVARMLRHYWTDQAPENMELCWVARRDAPGVDHVINDPADVDKLPQCNTVLALWGVVAGDEAALNANRLLAQDAQQIARRCGADRVLHASSVAVYSPASEPLSETADCAPRNPYGRAKLQMEQALSAAQPKAICLRMGNMAGADGLFAAMERGRAITLDQFADGSGPVRSYLAPSTLAHCVEGLARLPLARMPDTVNLAGRRPVAMADIVRAAGLDLNWKPAPEGALALMSVDVSQLAALVPIGDESTDAAALVAQWRKYGAAR